MATATASRAGGLDRIEQQDFSGGMFPSLAPELIPPNGAYDITNGLLDEEALVYRRGGSSYLNFVIDSAFGVKMLWSGYLEKGGLQTVVGTNSGVYVLQAPGGVGSNARGTITKLAAVGGYTQFVRPVAFQGKLYLPASGPASASWNGETVGSVEHPSPYFAIAGNRLLYAETAKPQMVESKLAKPSEFESNEFLEVPEAVKIIGLQGLRTSCVIFTTGGIWMASGLAKLLTDSAGNDQQTLDRYSADSILWGNAGVAGWSGGLVVPCRDDIWLMELGVSSEKSVPFAKISAPIHNLYRSYVNAGYVPGCAAVYRGHYFLPVMNGESMVDLLVCKLAAVHGRGRTAQPEYAWTHLSGYGAQCSAFAVVGNETGLEEEAAFIGGRIGMARLLQLNYFATSQSPSATDADGSHPSFSLTTRDIQTGNLVKNTVAKVRVSYRMVCPGGSGLKLAVGSTSATPAEWGQFNWGEANWAGPTGSFTLESETAPADQEGLNPFTWRVGKKVRYVRLRLELSGPTTSFSLRLLEIGVRPSGRIW